MNWKHTVLAPVHEMAWVQLPTWGDLTKSIKAERRMA